MIVASVLSILFSGALLALLGGRDPKRLRNLAHVGLAPRGHGYMTGEMTALPVSMRRAYAWLTLAPGLVLAFMGQWWAFLIWLGVICALGWVTSHLLARR